LIKIRSNARNEKNFKLSDEIRNELLNLGIKLNDDGSSSSFEIVK
jgi:cysteinyl-tRNA synthetase